MGNERSQSLIDVELARTEFRLDVIKLREQLGRFVPRLRPSRPAAQRDVAPAVTRATPSDIRKA
jgi:hypothetical protein